MCGIAGAVWSDGGGAISNAELDRMTDVLAHRGPDGRGVHREDYADGSGAALGHRRLSIIDLAGGAQPMSNEDGNIWITFNGEIYNYRELRPKLESAGHRFRTSSDTETIIHLYEEYGDRFVEQLRGMFAIAIWDSPRQRLVLARDRLGQKPLVYYARNGRLLFGSEIKSILAVDGLERRIRVDAIDEYLTYGYVPHPGTMFEDICKLPPAHLAVYERGQLMFRQYWDPDLEPHDDAAISTLREQLREAVDEAVRLRLRSDVPLGAFLSGGIDSTAIVGLMQRHAERTTNTFTIGFPVDGFDESEYARMAAQHLGTHHTELEVQPNSLGLLEKLVWHFDEPFADSSAVPTYYVSRMTREYVKVAITGDGGDELFAGYDRYRTIDRLGLFDRIPRFARSALTGPWWDWLPAGPDRSVRQRLKHRMRILREPLDRRYRSWVSGFQDAQRADLFRPDVAAAISGASTVDFLAKYFGDTDGCSPGVRAMRADLRTYLPCDLLAKVDITSMANGLECRSPFLDHHVVETAARIPFRTLTASRDKKPMITSTFAELIPPKLRTRPKMGFSVPLDRWFREDLREFTRDTLLASDAFSHTYFRPTAIRDLLDQHQNGQWGHGDRIWSLLFLELWGREFLGKPQVAASGSPS